MTPTQRQNYFGTSERKPYVPLHRQVADAEARGRQVIKDARDALAHDPASSANRKSAAATAQHNNTEAIAALKAGDGLGFNPLAKKR